MIIRVFRARTKPGHTADELSVRIRLLAPAGRRRCAARFRSFMNLAAVTSAAFRPSSL
jgi:hypothetical protein